MNNITELKEEKRKLLNLKLDKEKLIRELKEEKQWLLSNMKNESTAKKKAFFFASHYPYLNIENKQTVFVVSTILTGIFLGAMYDRNLFFLPYIIWVLYDFTRMKKLVKKANDSINEKVIEIDETTNEEISEIEETTNPRINEIDEILINHLKVKEAIEHTIKFLEKFNKKAS